MKKDQALLVVDVQNDFLETGALPVKDGSEVIEVINRISPLFNTVVFTQDWHPQDHISFASNHEGKKPYEMIEVSYGSQVLWPAHCIQQTEGAKLASGLNTSSASAYVQKGSNRLIDSYSAFLEADRKTHTPLEAWLKSQGIKEVFICGLATDFCVSWTALDAARAGFKVSVVIDASRAIDVNGSLQNAKEEWEKAGIKIIESQTLIKNATNESRSCPI